MEGVDGLAAARKELESGRMGEEDKRDLLTQLLDQYQDFYADKNKTKKKKNGDARRDVLQMFAPAWCSPLENAFHWFTGFRPTSLFPVIFASVHNLSHDQQTRLHRLKREIGLEEKALGEKQAEIHENMASEPIISMIKEISRRPNSARVADGEMHCIRAGMEAMVLEADRLRTKATTRIVEILNTGQSITFLLAGITAQRKMKVQGIERGVALQAGTQVEYE